MQKVYIVDDDVITRIMLERILEGADLPVQSFDSAESFLESDMDAAVLLLDQYLPGLDGTELQQKLKEMGHDSVIVFMSGSGDITKGVSGMKGGAVDWLHKPLEHQKILDAVQRALDIDLNNKSKMAQQRQARGRLEALTGREREVLHWVVNAFQNKMIANILGISVKTVESHRHSIFFKTKANSVLELKEIVDLAK